MMDLVGKGIRDCGTMLVNRKGFPGSLKDVKKMGKRSKERGYEMGKGQRFYVYV